jgi:hypothetical protein
MRPRDYIVAWRDFDAWTASDSFGLAPCGNSRVTTGYYLLVPVESEKAGLELAKRLKSEVLADSITGSP